MNNTRPSQQRPYTPATLGGDPLLRSDLELLHEALTIVKNNATKDGRIYSRHTDNAHLRTRIERDMAR